MRCPWFRFALVPLMMVLWSSAAEAQEKKVGLVVGYPVNVGVLWQASDRLALRTDVGFNVSVSEFTTEFGIAFGSQAPAMVTSTASTSVTTLGLSALFTMRNDDNLRLYVAPRGAIELVRQSTETEIEAGSRPSGTFPAEGEASGSALGHELQVSFGGQYRMRDRVAVFAESGVAYQSSEFPELRTSVSLAGVSTTTTARNDRSRHIGLRSIVGLVLFF